MALRWQDVDFDAGILHVRGTLKDESYRNPDGSKGIRLVLEPPKTANSERKIGLPPILLNAFMRHKDYLQKLQNNSASLGRNWQTTDWVFKTTVGSAYYPSNFYNRYRSFIETNGFRYIRFHDLRHTTAHLALEHGMILEALSQTLGHSRIDTTKTIYASKVSKLSIEFPLAFAEALMPLETQLETQLHAQPKTEISPVVESPAPENGLEQNEDLPEADSQGSDGYDTK